MTVTPSTTIGFALRGDTLARWTTFNPVLADRELVLETDTNQFKIGDGTSDYLDLPYGGLVGPSANIFSGAADQSLARTFDVWYTNPLSTPLFVAVGVDLVVGSGETAQYILEVREDSEATALAIAYHNSTSASDHSFTVNGPVPGDWEYRLSVVPGLSGAPTETVYMWTELAG